MAGEATKSRVLQTIAGSKTYTNIGKARYRVGGTEVHVRYKSKPSHGTSYPYNINPNTLRADYELWVCGESDGWYLIPMREIRLIYKDPDAYVDRRHPDILVVTVDVASHTVVYGSGGKSLDLRQHRNARLP